MKNIKELVEDYTKKCNVYPEDTNYKGPIYHFTDLNALKNILETGVLRFTYFKDLNDSTEMEYGLTQVQKILSEANIGEFRLIEMILKTFLEPSTDNLNTYICSFSKDYKSLPLWRYYGLNGHGVAICFDNNIPLVNEDQLDNYQIPTCSNVYYGDKRIKQIIKSKLDDLKKILRKRAFKRLSNEDEKKEIKRQLSVAITSHIIGLLPMIKDEDYKTENEARLLLLDGKLRDLKNHRNGCKFDYFYIDSEKHLPSINTNLEVECELIKKKRKYVQLSKFKKEAIKKIIIGQNCNKTIKHNVEKLLKTLNYPENILVEMHSSSYVG